MKRDSIHTGRRPSGLCGAALLIAARLHEFGRTPGDIIKIVKVHESTLRKRLVEFGDTPSSGLTLEEFMTIDLEEEQDPPSFKAARRKDRDRLQKLLDEEGDTITELQKEIEKQLDNKSNKQPAKRIKASEKKDVSIFIEEATASTIKEFMASENIDDPSEEKEKNEELGPNIASMGLANSLEDVVSTPPDTPSMEVDMSLDDIDDDEIDSYLLTEDEFKTKNGLWHKHNAGYLEQLKLKEETLAKKKEEGKPEKKKRRHRKKTIGPSNSAGEAIEKMLQEKKISSKINYDVLKSLNSQPSTSEQENPKLELSTKRKSIGPNLDNVKRQKLDTPNKKGKEKQATAGLPFVEDSTEEHEQVEEKKVDVKYDEEEEDYDDYEDEAPVAEENAEMGIMEMLQQHRDDEQGGEDGDYYDDY